VIHDVLKPAGVQAAHIADLWWLTFWVSLAVFVAILAALAWGLWRAPRGTAESAPEAPSHEADKRTGWRIVTAVGVSTGLLLWLLTASILTDRALASLPRNDALNLRITAHQWWWDVTYDDPKPDRVFNTANEIFIPVGRPVIATLYSNDVIHSFWVPNLHGKKDLIPGRTSTIQFRADQAGEYRGECAEFCGLQHAFMAFRVVALAPAEYDAWAESQRKPAAEPNDDAAKRGRELFLSGSCMLCHAVQGTSANARKGPDLTHVASRTRLAAGRLPNTRDEMARWIADPQKIKPGVNMPAHPLKDEDLHALVSYLASLK
jgi:cytochrome c oxidase subunit II